MAGRGRPLSAAGDLWRLQQADTHIAALRSDLAAAEALLRQDPELESARTAAGAAESERRVRDDAAGVAEREMNALQARVRTLDRRLYGGSVHNPQELLEMQHELETLRARTQDAEDRAISLLEEAEGAAAAERERAGALADAQTRRDAALAPLQARASRLREQLAAAEAERSSIADGLAPPSLALYNRVAQRRTPAVAALDGDSCGGCHLPLSNEERRLVRAGTQVVQCSNCDRVLVP